MSHERMLKRECEPTENQMGKWIGSRGPLWSDMREYLASHYEHPAEIDFAGKKYGWSIRYHKSGKTLVTLFPEQGGFTALIVLGNKEVSKAESCKKNLSKKVRELFENTDQLHDGRWLWIRPTSKADIKSIKILLTAKRRPKSGSI